MKTNKLKLNVKLLKYELINASSNVFTLIFSVAFPVFMSILFSYMFSADVPKGEIPMLNAGLYIAMIMVIPLAAMFIGHAANYSQEIESGILQRFKLFGYKEHTLLAAKIIANLIFVTAAVIVYTVVMFTALDVAVPNVWAFISLIVCVYLLAVGFLVLAHAIATLIGRFSATFGVTMGLYFAFMIFGGMMGFGASQFPPALQYICKALPMYYISDGFVDFWQTGSYNFLPLALSMIGLFAVAFGLLGLGIWKNKKGAKKPQKPVVVYYD